MDTFDKKYQREYELLLGEVNSGNSNNATKTIHITWDK